MAPQYLRRGIGRRLLHRHQLSAAPDLRCRLVAPFTVVVTETGIACLIDASNAAADDVMPRSVEEELLAFAGRALHSESGVTSHGARASKVGWAKDLRERASRV